MVVDNLWVWKAQKSAKHQHTGVNYVSNKKKYFARYCIYFYLFIGDVWLLQFVLNKK